MWSKWHPTAESLVALLGLSVRPFPLLESHFFLFGALEGGGSFLQEGCEFAEELLHKENVPHCLQGDGVCQMDPFFLCLILKRRLCSSSQVWTAIVLLEGIVLSNTKLRDTAEWQVFLINVLSGCMDFRHVGPYCVSSDPRGARVLYITHRNLEEYIGWMARVSDGA